MLDITQYFGAPGAIRTPDPLVRSQVLYPAELRARCVFEVVHITEFASVLQVIFDFILMIAVEYGRVLMLTWVGRNPIFLL